MTLRFKAIDTATAEAIRRGEPDAYGNPAEHDVSPGGSVPCRHCLKHIPAGQPMLILAYRPFPEIQPYAETGPIFLCAEPCGRHPDSALTPDMFLGWERLMVRGYTADNRIKYGTGDVVGTGEIAGRCTEIFANPEIRFIHLRSASNNCFQCRVERA